MRCVFEKIRASKHLASDKLNGGEIARGIGGAMPVFSDTPQRLADAFVDLCREMPFNKVTIKGVTARAGVSTRSFYTHFDDIYDLVAWLFQQRNRRHFENAFLRSQDFRAYSFACCSGFKESSEYQCNLVKNTHGRYALRVIVRTQMYELFSGYIREKYGEEALDKSIDFGLRYYLSFCTDALIDWFMEGMLVTPEELVYLTVDEMMPRRLRGFLLPVDGAPDGTGA